MGTSRFVVKRWLALLATAGLVASLASVTAPAAAAPAVRAVAPAAASAPVAGDITLHVQSARSLGSAAGLTQKGDAVTSYKWLINKDETGDPGTAAAPGLGACLPATAKDGQGNPVGNSTDPLYADKCQWPSVRKTSGFAPIMAQGNESDLNGTKSLNLPGGKYLISVTADNFKIDGEHFAVDGASQLVTVEMNPTPLPLTTLKIQVFEDSIPVDATYEMDAEKGISGFTAVLSDVLGVVSTDYYGNVLCTVYKHVIPADSSSPIAFTDGKPDIDGPATALTHGRCVSDSSGVITIPNMGPNRYASTVTPPAPAPGQTFQWVQTTTLEGGHDHDIWQQEGETGFDTEQRRGAELVPAVQFGFVKTQAIKIPARNVPTGEIKGVAIAALPYIGGQNGQTAPIPGIAGAKSGGPIKNPWIALSDLGNGDGQIYVGRGNADGSFDIKNVPNSTYQLSIWDDDQDYILWSFNVTVANGAPVNVGNKGIVGWFAHVYGKVFVDNNGNGKQDPGEPAVPQFNLTVRERDNSLMDQATNTMSTDSSGFYNIRETYPMGKWLILEAFNTRYKTTGITYKAENETTATTKLGSLVDVNFLPIIGLGGEIDWGVQPYSTGTNGGIVGTVTYDTTRNELDPADAATEPYQPGIPDIPVHLYLPTPCAATTTFDIANSCRQGKKIVPLQVQVPDPAFVPDPTNPDAAAPLIWTRNTDPNRGAFVKGAEIQDSYPSETWAPPRGCTARQWDGSILTDQQALPPYGTLKNPDGSNMLDADGNPVSAMCVEAPMMGIQTGPSDSTPGAAGQTVNGNYGFTSSKVNLYGPGNSKNPAPDHQLPLYADLHTAGYPEQDLPAWDYIVSVEIPTDPSDNNPMYKVTSEEDVNVFDGDTYLPQENMQSVTLAEATGTAGPPDASPRPPSQPPSQQAGIISPCVGALHKVAVTNEAFIAGGGSPFEGYDRPSCADKLVTVRSGQATAPNFSLFTEVPIPAHFWGLTLNDLGLSLDKRSANYGEAQGIPNVPVGLYDWAGRLVDTTHTDFNGMYEALEPSTDTFNCPLPAGPCPNMYRFVGNDPGAPGKPNADYNPRFRTIATNFQAWPGLYTVTDEAPTQVASTALAPDTTVANPTQCDLGTTAPQLLAVNKPYVRTTDAPAARTVTVSGFSFGSPPGTIKLGTVSVTPTSWSDKAIVFTVPNIGVGFGSQALTITRADKASSVNGLTIQVLGSATGSNSSSNPRIVEVAALGDPVHPSAGFHTVQAALEAARPTNSLKYWLVVVYPNVPTAATPLGEWNENVIVHHQVKIQGVGPGGFDPSGTYVLGSILDGSGFNIDNLTGNGANWLSTLSALTYSGDPAVPDAAAVTVLDDPGAPTLSGYPLSIDGFTITGGAQSDIAANVNDLTGGVKTPYGATGALITQGGGIYVHSNVRGLQVTDNIIRGNGGAYGGAIRVGTPYVGDNRNYDLNVARNQIRDNGGTNLAGGIGLFKGSDGYQVTDNAICGNFSAEYGGAISAFGYQATASGRTQLIARNKIWFNQSYDEGGAVMIAGELPAVSTDLSEGTGPVTINANVISLNLANDDGGAIRLLQVSGSHISTNLGAIDITNNTISDNVSAHEGGGIALDDAAFVNVVNNTISKNLTTATAVTSNGSAAPAGLSTATNSLALQTKLATMGTAISNGKSVSRPTLFNDIFFDNRAGRFSGGWVYGIGAHPSGTNNDITTWDMGVADNTSIQLVPTYSVLNSTTGFAASPTNLNSDPKFVQAYGIGVSVLPSRMYPAFRQAVIVTQILPLGLQGDYHLASGSPARGGGTATKLPAWSSTTVKAPTSDIDGQARPSAGTTRYDVGSDQMTP